MFSKKSISYLAGIAALVCCAFAIAGHPADKPQQDPSDVVADAESLEALVPQKKAFSQDDIEKISEAFGHLIGKNLESPGFTFDIDAIVRGMRNAVAGQEAPMSDGEYEEMISIIQENAFLELAENNLKDAEKFLKENILNDDVSEIEAGKLQYAVLEEGEGAVVADKGSPRIHYTGKYLDGTVFGSSVETGTPITLSLDQTIPGFSKGLVGMKSGEKRRLFIHPDMGYGTTGHLPPNSLLVFDVEIVEVDSMMVDLNDIIGDYEEMPSDDMEELVAEVQE